MTGEGGAFAGEKGGGYDRRLQALAALRGRGYIRKNYGADITIFDADQVADVATFEDPHRYAVGIHFVIVNGHPIFDDGQRSPTLPGRVLKGDRHGTPA